MNLDFLNNLANNLKENKVVQNFIKEVGEYLDKNNSEDEKISIVARNTIRKNKKEILEKYGQEIETEEIKKEIEQMKKEVLNRQNQKLKEFRKEGNYYRVEEDRENRIFLADTTNNIVLEEVEFPKELLNKAKEGALFQYKDGTYHFCK